MAMIMAATSMVFHFAVTTSLVFILGDSITFFSIFTGLFLFSMGVGAYLSNRLPLTIQLLIKLQLAMGLAGLILLPIIFLIYGYFSQFSESFLQTSILWIIGIISEVMLGVVAGMHLPVLKILYNSSCNEENKTVAQILSYDYVGSFFGAAMYPLIFFPYFGLLKSVFLFAIINCILAGISLFILMTTSVEAKKSKARYGVLLFILLLLFLQSTAYFQSDYLEYFITGLVYDNN